MDASLMTMTDEELEREQHVARNGWRMTTDDRLRTDRYRRMKSILEEWERRYAMKMKKTTR